ncbi:SIR2 family protein [Aeromonas salmonicida]|uniref:SIR2 family protein n=3 Tax=Aeromonas salmonicida TaxID=645 RepID=UPI003D21A232
MRYEQLRNELSHKERSISDLIDYIKTKVGEKNPNYSLLLGAGASFTSGINTGVDLINEWRKEIYLRLSGVQQYTEDKAVEYLKANEGSWYTQTNEYSSLFEKKFDLPSQRRRFVEKEVDNKLPSIGYCYLVSLVNNSYFNTIYTTNFDDLINEAFYQFSHTRPFLCAHDSSIKGISINNTRPKIVKLHGDYLFDDIKSTLRETESLEGNTRDKLVEFCKEFGLIIVGYSGNDRSIMDVLNHLLKTDEYLKNGLYWCLRENDYINPELRKLLWKERVYYVKIDGFDELMATVHHNILGGMSLNDNFKNSKKDAIIDLFTEDKYSLSLSSDNIKKDIENIKKHKTNLDISNLIRELNENDNRSLKNKLPEIDFKNMLQIDNLRDANKLDQAKNFADMCINSCSDDDIKIIYMKRLVKINKSLGQLDAAMELCDKIIDADHFNIDSILTKASLIKDLEKRCEYLISVKDDFLTSYVYHNYMARSILKLIGHMKTKKISSTYTHTNAIQYIDKSLTLEPSLDNPAWEIKLDLIHNKYDAILPSKDRKEKDEAIKKLIDSAKAINDSHSTIVDLTIHPAALKNDLESYLAAIKKIDDIIATSKKSKRNRLVESMCGLYVSLSDCESNDGYKKKWQDFIEGELPKELNENNNTNFLMCKALYSINVERNLQKAKELISIVLENDIDNGYPEKILNLSIDLGIDEDLIITYINRVKDNYSKDTYYKLMFDFYLYKQEFSPAIESIKNAYSEGMGFDEFCIRNTFALLINEEYEQVISFIEMNIDGMSSLTDKDILIINRELANQKLNKSVNEVAVNNVIGHKFNDLAVLCAHCILSDTKSHEVKASALLKKHYENNYRNILMFKRWPAIPKSMIQKITYENAANKTAHDTSEFITKA